MTQIALTHDQAYDEALAAYVALLKQVYTCGGSFTVEPGRSFDKIVNGQGSSRSVHSFVAKKDGDTKALGPRQRGDILKAAGWKAPAKHPRGSIFGNPADALDGNGHVKYLK